MLSSVVKKQSVSFPTQNHLMPTRVLRKCPYCAGSPVYRNRSVRCFITQRYSLRVSQRLGHSVRWWWDQGVVKHPVSGSTFPWHPDDAYESTDPPRSLNAILSIDSTTQENGCLWVIPGSHHDPLHEHWTEPGEWHRRCYNGNNPGIPVESAPGDIIFLHCRTIHCSHENRSDSRRRT